MLRKSILSTPDEMTDEEMFQPGMRPADIRDLWHAQEHDETSDRRTRLFADLASLSKRFVNEGVAFEAVLTERGLRNVSAAIYSLEWSKLYYQAETERQRLARMGYWKRLWRALCNQR